MRIGFLFLFLIPVLAKAQSDPRRFDRYSAVDGLSQNTINCMIQDRYGFMWIGTQDGLNRFDGKDFQVYRFDQDDSTSLSYNYIWTLLETSDGSIWAGTFGGGLNRYDPRSDRFSRYQHDANDPNSIQNDNIFNLVESPAGTLWIGTNNGLAKLDMATGIIQRFHENIPPEGGTGNNFTGPMDKDENGTVWFRSDTGFFSIDPLTDLLTEYSLPQSVREVFSISCWGDSIVLTTNDGVKFRTIKDEIYNELIPLGESAITGLLKSPTGKIWGASKAGLVEFDPKLKKLKLHRNFSADETSIPHDAVMSLARSKDGVLWVGTRKGLATLARESSPFKLIQHEHGTENTLTNPVVNAVLKDQKGRTWIGTSEGLTIQEGETFYRFYHDPKDPNSISVDYILNLFEDADGTVWIGTRNGGVCRVDELVLGEVPRLKVTRVPDLGNSVQQVIQDENGKLWLATSGAGLVGLNKEDLSLDRYPFTGGTDGPSHPYIFYMFQDSFDNFWVGTPVSGLNLFDRASKTFLAMKREKDRPSSLSSNGILSIQEDDNRLWVGTAAGLNRLEPELTPNMSSTLNEDAAFHYFGRKDGLPNEVIYSIEKPGNGLFYLTTNEGLVEFDPESATAQRVFTVSDGLQSNEFNMTSSFMDHDGTLYLGGVDGVSVFNPSDLTIDSTLPGIQITGLELYADPVSIGQQSHGFQLDSSLLTGQPINLKYHNKVITFNFAGLGFASPKDLKFKYRLTGFDEEWIETEERFATFTNLDPGSYTFEVMVANHKVVWNPAPDRIELNIPPPPWRTWWAYSIYAILIIMIIYLVIRQRIEAATRELKIQARIAADREAFRKESAANFHDEVGNRITRISLYLGLLKQRLQGNEEDEKQLAGIERNTKELAAGMRDFLWVLDASKGSVKETFERLEQLVRSNVEDAGIKVNSRFEADGVATVILSMEARKTILQIFKEAVNNCLKYAQADALKLNLEVQGENIMIEFSDNGVGFEEGELKGTGYGTGIMKDRAEKLGGKLSVSSKKNEGTSVTFICPITHLRDAG